LLAASRVSRLFLLFLLLLSALSVSAASLPFETAEQNREGEYGEGDDLESHVVPVSSVLCVLSLRIE
jgi:hypothetical protein